MKLHSLEKFTESALCFMKESADWNALDESRHYKSDNQGGWSDTCDGDTTGFGWLGGLDVAWAFKMSEQDVIAEAPHVFISELLKHIEILCESGDTDAIIEYMDCYR